MFLIIRNIAYLLFLWKKASDVINFIWIWDAFPTAVNIASPDSLFSTTDTHNSYWGKQATALLVSKGTTISDRPK